MALRPQPTLAELRSDLKTLIVGSSQAAITGDDDALWNSYIRRAQAEVYEEADFLINRVIADLPIALNDTQCDFPDATEPGKIKRVSAKLSTGLEWEVKPGITPEDRSAWNLAAFGNSAYFPYKYDYQNGVILFGPKASSGVTLSFQYLQGKSPLVSEGDRPAVDGEVLLRKAEILAKVRYAPSEVPLLQANFDKFLQHKRANQATGEMFVIAGDWMDPAMRKDRRRRGYPWWTAGRRPVPGWW